MYVSIGTTQRGSPSNREGKQGDADTNLDNKTCRIDAAAATLDQRIAPPTATAERKRVEPPRYRKGQQHHQRGENPVLCVIFMFHVLRCMIS